MEKLTFNINRFQIAKKKITMEQDLADQIYKWSDKKLNFGMLMRFIKRAGYQSIYEIFQEVSKGDAQTPVALFMWKVKNVLK